MNGRIVQILSVLSALGLVASAEAQGKGQGQAKGQKTGTSGHAGSGARGSSKAPGDGPSAGHVSRGGAAVHVTFHIEPSERDLIQGYVKSHGKAGARGQGLPPGLARKTAAGGRLPPGWEKKCVAGEIMPLAVFEVCHPLPTEIVVKLPPPPPDTVLIAVDGRVFRVCKKTRRIHGVFVVHL